MGPRVPETVPVAKGAICFCWMSSRGRRGARPHRQAAQGDRRSSGLRFAACRGVSTSTWSRTSSGAPKRAPNILAHLNAFWFDPRSKQNFFPGVDVSRIYAMGVLETLDLSLQARRAAPFRSAPGGCSIRPSSACCISPTSRRQDGGRQRHAADPDAAPGGKGRAARAVGPVILGNRALCRRHRRPRPPRRQQAGKRHVSKRLHRRCVELTFECCFTGAQASTQRGLASR